MPTQERIDYDLPNAYASRLDLIFGLLNLLRIAGTLV